MRSKYACFASATHQKRCIMLTLLNKIRSFRHFDIVFSLCVILVGLMTILFPGVAVYILSIGLGILLFCFGIEGMVQLFAHRESDLYFFIRFIANLLLIFCAIGLLFFGSYFTGLVCTAVGMLLLVDSSIKLFDLLSRPQKRDRSFWVRLSVSALSFILGLALVITPTTILLGALRLLGVALLVEGISSLVYYILRLGQQRAKKNDPEIPIESSFTDRSDT